MIEYRIVNEEKGRHRETFCNNLRFILRAKGISRELLAKKLGVSLTTVKNYALGRTFPDEHRIEQIADILGCSMNDLFDDNCTP